MRNKYVVDLWSSPLGEVVDISEDYYMKTPKMNHDSDAWLKAQVSKAIDDKCSISKAADRIGISLDTAKEYYYIVMLKRSLNAIHPEHGNVRVYEHVGWFTYFIFHATQDKLIGNAKIGDVDWKCPPLP